MPTVLRMGIRFLTVDDIWHLSDDATHLEDAAAVLRARAAELEAAGAIVRRGQHALGRLLDWIEVPMTWHPGRLTFFPRDGADLTAIATAREAAEEIHAAVRLVVTSALSAAHAPISAGDGPGG